MTYIFKYKKMFFWKKVQVVGHRLEEHDIMVLFKQDGGLETIPQWSKHKLILGPDWALFVKKQQENETGVNLKTNF